MANCTELFTLRARDAPKSMALWLPGRREFSFGELSAFAGQAQRLCRDNGITAGDSVLLVDDLGPRLYATIIGVLSLGGSVILVEPWMPVAKIQRAVQLAKPKIFLTSPLGRLWGLRVAAIRAIPKWLSVSAIEKVAISELRPEQVDPKLPGIITFTTGTTGEPKGVVRTQGYLVDQHRILSHHLELEAHRGSDFCIFANFALANLASGRGSVLMPRRWKPAYFKEISELPPELIPVTLTCGPAFLLELMRAPALPSLKAVHIGGALTDCWIFEEGFKRWPGAHWTHVYGSSEVEPVATCDAKKAVAESRTKGRFQTLHLGKPVPELQTEIGADGAWVTGPHVCPQYLGGPELSEENKRFKKRDAQGRVWHFMGDRVVSDSAGWWYGGRSGQQASDFELEQRIYSLMQSSKSFVDRNGSTLTVVGEGVTARARELRAAFPELSGVREGQIFRDPRHRARIDRVKSLMKAGKSVS